MKKIIGAILVLGLIFGGVYAVSAADSVNVAMDPGGGGH